MASAQHEFRSGGAADAARGSMKHHGPGGAFFCPAEDTAIMRLSPSGMSRRGSSGELELNVPLRETASTAYESRFARAGSAASDVTASSAYVGPFGRLGEDPDCDHAAVTTDHGPHDIP